MTTGKTIWLRACREETLSSSVPLLSLLLFPEKQHVIELRKLGVAAHVARKVSVPFGQPISASAATPCGRRFGSALQGPAARRGLAMAASGIVRVGHHTCMRLP